MNNLLLRNWGLDARKYKKSTQFKAFLLGLGFIFLAFLCFACIDVIRVYDYVHARHVPTFNPHNLLALLYLVIFITGAISIQYLRNTKDTGNIYFVTLCMSSFVGVIIFGLVDFIIQMFFAKILSNLTGIAFDNFFSNYFKHVWPELLIIFLIAGFCAFMKWRMLLYKTNIQRNSQDTSSNLGSALMATETDITNYGLRGEGALIGKDTKGYLRTPKLTDRLILGFRGGGKTSSLLIPLILDYVDTNKFILDIKGELTAVTGRKAKLAGRKVFVIDPFNVVKSLGIKDIETHCINPLAHIKVDDALEFDRYITSLAAALCSSDQGKSETEKHFSENSQIIIEGILDFYIDEYSELPDQLNLVAFHDWWLNVLNDPENEVISQMQFGSHKAKAAVAQLKSAGKNELGSILTTIYRQLQWLRGEAIRNCFSSNEIDLNAFSTGNCDIYVVLPEDMIKAYSRMVRVIMGLIKVKLIQTSTTALKPDYCFVLDECGQFGYCPDIELMINTMRSRGVKIWASFQTLEQIEVYEDDIVFKGMPVKHFLSSNDLKTLKWIQELGGKKTVLTENVSRNTSGGSKGLKSSNSSETRSISETSTNLIQLNEIREMQSDEQIVFIDGMRPIRCKKAFYFKEPIYKDRFDVNPLEKCDVV